MTAAIKWHLDTTGLTLNGPFREAVSLGNCNIVPVILHG